MQSYFNAIALCGKLFPYLKKLEVVYGKDRATSEATVDARDDCVAIGQEDEEMTGTTSLAGNMKVEGGNQEENIDLPVLVCQPTTIRGTSGISAKKKADQES